VPNSGFNISFDRFLNTLTGRLERLKTGLEVERVEEEKEKIDKLLGEQFFTKELNLPPIHIENFLYFCLEDQVFKEKNLKSQPLELITFLKNKLTVYKKNNFLD